MRCYVLTNIAVFTPIINERKLEKCHVHSTERQNIFMG